MTYAFIQARQNSKRFENKIFSKINDNSIIEWINFRINKCKNIKKSFFLIPNNYNNNKLKKYIIKKKYKYLTGPENDVLKRFYTAALAVNAENIVRICADNPFICWKTIDNLVNFYKKNKCDYAYNHIPINNNFPDGIGAEIISFKKLEYLHNKAKKKKHREHIFDYIWENKNDFNIKTYFHRNKKLNYPNLKFDINYDNDLHKLQNFNANINDESTVIIKKYINKYRAI
tara:strand:- start:212 stop:901 length:690 start_codon:yes stop_codon:yes gene_type:complete